MRSHILADAAAKLVAVDIHAVDGVGAVIVVAPDVNSIVMPYVGRGVPVRVVVDGVAINIDACQRVPRMRAA